MWAQWGQGEGGIRLGPYPHKADKWRWQTCEPGLRRRSRQTGFQRRCPTQVGGTVVKEGFLEEVADEVWDRMGRVVHAKAWASSGHAVPLGDALSQATPFPTSELSHCLCPLPRMPFPLWASGLAPSHPLCLSSEGPSYTPASSPQHRPSFCLPSTYQKLSCLMIC